MYKLIKHRGSYSALIKENSYDAIKTALDNPLYIGVEFDIRCTKDNKFILFHDPIYNNKLISNTYYYELPKYVVQLENVLSIKSDKIFLIEIKNINNNYKQLFTLLNRYNNKNIYVMSFSNRIINKMDMKKRKYKIGVLNYVLNTSNNIKDLDFVGILNSLITKDYILGIKSKEIFAYGLLKVKKYESIYYIVDE